MITNQAFIKAYRHDAAHESPPGPVMADATRTAVRGSPDHALVRTERLLDVSSGRPAVDDVARSGDRPPHAAEKQPLSSFIALAEAGRAGAGEHEAAALAPGPRPQSPAPWTPPSPFPPPPSPFRPGTTLASFQWPAVCRALAQQSSQQLDRVAELLLAQAEAGCSLIGVLGLFSGCGATTTALCLAARLAGRGRRLILVDGNFSKPGLATRLEASPTAGWQDVLLHGTPLADAAVRATDDRLDLLALGPMKQEDALRLVGGLQAVVTAGVLRHAYELVLVDAGAYFDSASQPVVLELTRNMGIDAVLAVAGPPATDARDLDTLAEQLGRRGCELLGVIENEGGRRKAEGESRESRVE